MATYYISVVDEGETIIYALNTTTNIETTLSGELTQHRLEDGQVAADNYLSRPDSFSLSGIISDVFVPGSLSESERKSTKDYIEGLRKLKDSATPFTLHYASDLTPAYPCFFNSVRIIQTENYGFVGTRNNGDSVNSYQVIMSISQARIGQIASIVTGRASEFVDPTVNKTEASSPTQTATGEDAAAVDAYLQLIKGSRQIEEGLTGTELSGG